MVVDNEKIYELIVRSFSGELSMEERDQLNKWINSNPSNKLEYYDYLEIWKKSNLLQIPEIDVPASLKKTRQMAGINNKNFNLIPFLIRTAAIFILAILISVVYNKYIRKNQAREYFTLQEIKAAFGTQTRIQLPDGSVVFLNSGSTLRFPNSFIGKTSRDVELIGEGYFNVKKDNTLPFIVTAKKIQIEVLGTSFNVTAYQNEPSATIALVEGSIRVGKTNKNHTIETFQMRKNQVCIFDSSKSSFKIKNEANLNRYIAWTEGKIVFFNDYVNTVVSKLENWYNVDIEINDKEIEKYRFTGTFINEPIEQVLNILSLTSNMQYKIYPALKTADNSYSKRKIILRSK